MTKSLCQLSRVQMSRHENQLIKKKLQYMNIFSKANKIVQY